MADTLEVNALEPTKPETRPSQAIKPWSAKATLGLTLLLFVLYFIVSFISLMVGSGLEAASAGISAENAEAFGQEISQRLILDGDFNAINYFVTALCLSPLIFYFAQKRKVTSAAAYLGFSKYPSKATFINFNIAILAYFVFSYFATGFLGIESPQSIIDLYNTTDYLLLLFLAVVIAAPIFEELVFRGFMFKGLKYSPLRVVGSIIITSVLFTVIHAGQYDLNILAVLFPLAAILGLARQRSGGIYLPIYLHFVNNFYSSVEIYLMMN